MIPVHIFGHPCRIDEIGLVDDDETVVQDRLDALDAWELDSRLDLAMDALRCPPPDTPAEVLSGGERRRAALAAVLFALPGALLLDPEPAEDTRPVTRLPAAATTAKCSWT